MSPDCFPMAVDAEMEIRRDQESGIFLFCFDGYQSVENSLMEHKLSKNSLDSKIGFELIFENLKLVIYDIMMSHNDSYDTS